MRHRVSLLAAFILVVTAPVVMAQNRSNAPVSSKQRDFIIAGSDGYGTQDCLASGSSCGRIVADAWCESKGFKAALAYRKLGAEEITGSTSAGSKPADSFLISCRD